MTTGAYIVSAILSSPMLFTNMLPIEFEVRIPPVEFEQLSYCTTTDEDVLPACVGLYREPLLLDDGSILLPIKFPVTQFAFMQDKAAGQVVAYQ